MSNNRMPNATHAGLIWQTFQRLFRSPIGSIIVIQLIAMSITLGACLWAKTPYVFWFYDAPHVVLAVFFYILILAVSWDGLLFIVKLILYIIQQRVSSAADLCAWIKSLEKLRFFSFGISPLLMILLTVIALLYTSNITLLNLKLLEGATHWRDCVYWGVEQNIFRTLVKMSINVKLWDRLYHSAWIIELTAAFAIIILGRGGRIISRYCISMILLFYLGRFLGVLSPVMGPAFYQPKLFTYLEGSATQQAMQLVTSILQITPERAKSCAGILLGGVSAMPSLHVGMVTLTSYWLVAADRRTRLIAVFWILSVWASTVVLGWHYILDGAGGIILGWTCAWLVRRMAKFDSPEEELT